MGEAKEKIWYKVLDRSEELAEGSPHPADTLAASLPVEVREAVVDANLRLQAVEEKLRRKVTPTGAGTSG